MSTKPTIVTLFAGGGGSTMGAMAAGYEPVLSVEYDAKIANTYAENFGHRHLIIADVCAVDYKPYAGATMLNVSPPCTNASQANQKATESLLDLSSGQAVARALAEIRPQHFVMENVAQYQKFAACKIITDKLDSMGYWWQASVLNAADFGVPQTRKRLIVRASLDYLPPLPAPVVWRGWHDTIADRLHACPPSELAAWQKARLPADLNSRVLISGSSVDLVVRPAYMPAPTVKASKNNAPFRVLFPDGQCIALNLRCLTLFQNISDNYILPADRYDGLKIVGNMVPPKMMQTICEAFPK